MHEHTPKIALVTGASRGIGRATALALAVEGWDVVVNYAGAKDAAEQTCRMIKENGRSALLAQADVSNGADLDRLFDRVLSEFGRLDLLVNNAGVSGTGLLETL